MRRTRQKASHSPAKKQSPGLFLLMILAAGLGVFVVSCANKVSGPSPNPTAARTGSNTRSAAQEGRVPEDAHKSDQPAKQMEQSQDTAGNQTAQAENKTPEETATPEQSSTPGVTVTPTVPPSEHPKQVRRNIGGYHGELSQVAGSGPRIALTFDAGASPAPTPAILKALRTAGVHVTFFLTGKWCEQNPDLVKRIVDEGHEIGNHTYSHKDLRKLPESQINEQLDKTDQIIVRLTGRSTKPFFRPPYGGRDKRVLGIAAQDGYTSVYWAVDSWDAFKKGITSEEIKTRVLDRIQGGDIVLMHCGSQPTAEALPSLIHELQSRGYQIVPVSELAH